MVLLSTTLEEKGTTCELKDWLRELLKVTFLGESLERELADKLWECAGCLGDWLKEEFWLAGG